MSDDELMLNFAPPEESVSEVKTQQPKFKGGTWRERRDMKLKLQGRERKRAAGVNAIEMKNNKLEELRQQAEKKFKEKEFNPQKKQNRPERLTPKDQDKGVKRRETEQLGIPAKKVKFTEKSGDFGGKDSSYVSSLFTSKTPSGVLQESLGQESHHLPSNAPLADASTFSGIGMNEKLASHLQNVMRYTSPTEIQRAVVPSLLSSQSDLFVKAQTGSGKTLAFVLPMIDRIMREQSIMNRLSGLFGIILAPTRELASQIYSVLESVLRCYHLVVPGIVVGGEKKKSEKARIRKGVNILVGTPGRLADHFENTTALDVSQVRWLILDEGDRLVELGFQETITKITEHLTNSSKIAETESTWPLLPTRRVNVLCSATMPDDVKTLGSTVLQNPQWISIDKREKADSKGATAPDQLVQKIMVVPPKLRLVTLAGALKRISKNYRENNTRSIVFFSCSDSVNFHYDVFTRGGSTIRRKERQNTQPEENDKEKDEEETVGDSCVLTAPQVDDNTIIYRLHGSLTQQQRTSTLQQFVEDKGVNENKHLILFCTDVGSRGLDLPNITDVVEYDPPFAIDDHLHRIGRSARVGKKGEATLFLLPGEEEGYVEGKLKAVHPKEGSLRVINYETILKDSFGEKGESQKNNRDPKAKEGKWDIHATTWHLEVERWLLEDSKALERALQAFTSHIRAYATHLSSERQFFNVKLLHLGHLAKSFGLRETPKKLGRTSGEITNRESKKKEDPKKKMLRMARMAEKAQSSEFNY